ncbi:MAG: 8-hydroxy-5-deazaflavin:NADPH oxidoreductase, partial [Mycobacterium sp.]|nr:8-hydroxy-5-deazaflavin:NADPH oxidoreductase [Mycobacterium sp.]
ARLARTLTVHGPGRDVEPRPARQLTKGIDMQVGIIGAGSVGSAVAAVATRQGHDVMVSNARGPDTLSSFVDPIGCKAGTPAEAAVFGDIVLLAIPLKAYHTVPVAQLEGRIVLDATNYHPERDGHIDELDRDEITTSELLGRHLPKSTIIKAFNAITAADIESDGLPSGWPGRRALPIAGDDDVAKKVVAELLDELGYDTVDAGPLVEGRRFQKDTPAYCIPMDFKGLHATVYNTFNPLAPRRTPLAAPDVGR